MANKLVLSSALLLALVAFASATRYTTVVTTTFDDDDTNPQKQQEQQQQCQSQQFQGKQFDSCKRWINPVPWHQGQQGSQQQQQQGDEPLLIEMVNSQEGAKALTECCVELRQVENECRCEAINHAVRQINQDIKQQEQQQQMPGGKVARQQVKQLIQQRASEIPKRCNFREPKQCQIGKTRTIFF